MGKAIVIKNSDFSLQNVGKVNFVNKGWMFGVGDKMSAIINDIETVSILTASNWYFYGVSSPLLFSGRTIKKIAIYVPNKGSDYTLTYGICSKDAITGGDVSSTFEQKGQITIPYNAQGSIIDITPFSVPLEGTVIFTLGTGLSSNYGFVSIGPNNIKEQKSYGIPGLDRTNDSKTTYTASSTMRLFIDFYAE